MNTTYLSLCSRFPAFICLNICLTCCLCNSDRNHGRRVSTQTSAYSSNLSQQAIGATLPLTFVAEPITVLAEEPSAQEIEHDHPTGATRTEKPASVFSVVTACPVQLNGRLNVFPGAAELHSK